MKKERSSNFELLRIVLMIVIPLYHLMIYNGVFYMEPNNNVILGLAASSGGAIVADYAFIALSSYFLQQVEGKPIIYKFLMFLLQVGTVYVIRYIVVRSMFPFDAGNYFIEDMIMHGSWWFVYAYLILLLIYPILNKFIFHVNEKVLAAACFGLGVWFTCNGLLNKVNFVNDMVAFLFTYLFIGYMRRREFGRFLFLKTRKRNMVALYTVLYIITFSVCCFVKLSWAVDDIEMGNKIIRVLVGKYCIVQFVMGIAIFLFFKNLEIGKRRLINLLAKATFFIFLLHETVMACFWHFGKINGQYAFYSHFNFVIWACIYILACFGAGVFVCILYNVLLEPIWKKIVGKICKMKWIKQIENKYIEVTGWN